MSTQRSRGLVVWITGLSCSGKTTVAHELTAILRRERAACLVLDGDELRSAIADDLGYGLDDRRRCAWRYARLATALARQDVCVVVATVSPFEDVRRWVRATAPDYFEVFLRVPRALRLARDRRGIYRRPEVIGEDLPFEPPPAPDLIIDDDGGSPARSIALRIGSALAARGASAATGTGSPPDGGRA
ncbi:adenylyl-sulfate kinase [Candidatus Binatia bacterium]|nr:adenylyl-sulfate kinase [Candidatus Binatia bacterium]